MILPTQASLPRPDVDGLIGTEPIERVTAVLLGLTWSALLLRVWTRGRIAHCLGCDDAVIGVAIVNISAGESYEIFLTFLQRSSSLFLRLPRTKTLE